MYERYPIGVQTDRLVFECLRRPVFHVAHNGMTHGSQLGPDLVKTTRHRIHLQEGLVAAFLKHLVGENGLFGIIDFFLKDFGFVQLTVFADEAAQFLFFNSRHTIDQRPVGFFDLRGPEQFVHTRQAFAGFGQYDNATDGAIDTVNDATEDIAGFIVSGFDKVFDHIGQRFGTFFIVLYDDTRGFIDDDQVIIFIEDNLGDINVLFFR